MAPRQKVVHKELYDRVFSLEFYGESDYKFVMNGGTWKHKGNTLIVVPYDGISRPSEVATNSIPIWIQIFDLPGRMISEEVCMQLGDGLGHTIEVHKESGQLLVGKYLRVRVDIPVQKALKPWVEVRVNGRMEKFDVKYECVPFVCFKCGRMGHAERECQYKPHKFA